MENLRSIVLASGRTVRLSSLFACLALGLFSATGAQATTIDLSSGTAFSFQDEGTTNIDQTSLLTALDGSWAPEPTGSVTQSYYATGTSSAYFDAISLNFDLSSIGFENIFDAKLRFYLQKGDYATVDGATSFSSSRNAWEHYQMLQGGFNPTNQDYGPFNANIVGTLTDFGGAGALPQNTTVGWLEASIDTSWITSDSFDITLRLWNARIDRIELEIVPEPSAIALLAIGLAGLGFSRRRKSC